MTPDSAPDVTDKGRLLFGAGFAFGVTFALFVLALVTVAVVNRLDGGVAVSDIIATIAAGVLFTGVVGISLYILAFPENRLELSLDGLFEADDGTEK